MKFDDIVHFAAGLQPCSPFVRNRSWPRGWPSLSLSLSRRYYYVYRSKRWNRVGSVPYPKREHASSDVGLHAREIHHARYTLSLISTCARSHFLLRHDSRYQTPRSISSLISASRLRGRNIARVVPGKLETDLFQNFARFEEIRERERERDLSLKIIQ